MSAPESRKLTAAALERCQRTPPPEVLRCMRRLEMLLLQRKVDQIKAALDADQADIDIAFQADELDVAQRNKGWEP